MILIHVLYLRPFQNLSARQTICFNTAYPLGCFCHADVATRLIAHDFYQIGSFLNVTEATFCFFLYLQLIMPTFHESNGISATPIPSTPFICLIKHRPKCSSTMRYRTRFISIKQAVQFPLFLPRHGRRAP